MNVIVETVAKDETAWQALLNTPDVQAWIEAHKRQSVLYVEVDASQSQCLVKIYPPR